jgi:hypothetical protein
MIKDVSCQPYLCGLEKAPGACKVACAHFTKEEHFEGVVIAARAHAKGPHEGQECVGGATSARKG